jgi:hypothetical protein
MLLLDTGARRAEITGLTLDDLDLDLDVLMCSARPPGANPAVRPPGGGGA